MDDKRINELANEAMQSIETDDAEDYASGRGAIEIVIRKALSEEVARGNCPYKAQAAELQTKLDEIVRITDNSPGCDPVAAVRHLWSNAGDMVRELTKLCGEVRTYREMADRRGDLLERCRAELHDEKKRA